MTDSQHLLAEYRQSGSDAAFRELVERFVDLVYSTALRLVEGDTHRAEDVTQTVFVDLARKARTLPEDVKLGGWLHRDTCFAAATLMRGERRRQSRERQAVEMNTLQDHSEEDFSQVAPLLDEAINELDEADRTAILLRFFEQQEFRAVGLALGSNEDAARMRVTRALEKLEEFLKRRGVTTSAASLGVVLAANAVQTAPVGLAVTISTAAALAGTTLATTATATAVNTIAMTTLQKAFVVTALAAAVGTGIYEARQASQLREQNQVLQQQRAPLAEQIRQLQSERDEAKNRLVALTDEIAKMKGNAGELLKLRGLVASLRGDASQVNDPFVQTALRWKAKKEQLQKLFAERPQQRIPEMQFLNDQQWLDIARDSDLDSEDGILSAFAAVRHAGKQAFAPMIQKAIVKYMDANNGSSPESLVLLRAHFDPPLDDALLERYELLDKKAQELSNGLVVKEKNVVDPMREGLSEIGPHSSSTRASPEPISFPRVLSPALRSYMTANNGQFPKDWAELEPYATSAEQKAELEKLIIRLKHRAVLKLQF